MIVGIHIKNNRFQILTRIVVDTQSIYIAKQQKYSCKYCLSEIVRDDLQFRIWLF